MAASTHSADKASHSQIKHVTVFRCIILPHAPAWYAGSDLNHVAMCTCALLTTCKQHKHTWSICRRGKVPRTYQSCWPGQVSQRVHVQFTMADKRKLSLTHIHTRAHTCACCLYASTMTALRSGVSTASRTTGICSQQPHAKGGGTCCCSTVCCDSSMAAPLHR